MSSEEYQSSYPTWSWKNSLEKLEWLSEKLITSQILTVHWIREAAHAKNLEVTQLFVDFSKAFDSIHRGKKGHILLAHVPKEIVIIIMMLYKNMKAMVQSSNNNINFFNIFIGVLQGDTSTAHLFIIIITIMSYHQHGYPWPSVTTSPYHSSPLAGLQGCIPYPHRAAVCMFMLVILLLLSHICCFILCKMPLVQCVLNVKTLLPWIQIEYMTLVKGASMLSTCLSLF